MSPTSLPSAGCEDSFTLFDPLLATFFCYQLAVIFIPGFEVAGLA
jgi:hypothetical protein